MLKSMLLVSAVVALAFSASAAQADGGCGVGSHRGPGGGRRPNVVRGPAVIVPVPAPVQRHEAAIKNMHRLRTVRLQRDVQIRETPFTRFERSRRAAISRH
jgi:hypothetical protein